MNVSKYISRYLCRKFSRSPSFLQPGSDPLEVFGSQTCSSMLDPTQCHLSGTNQHNSFIFDRLLSPQAHVFLSCCSNSLLVSCTVSRGQACSTQICNNPTSTIRASVTARLCRCVLFQNLLFASLGHALCISLLAGVLLSGNFVNSGQSALQQTMPGSCVVIWAGHETQNGVVC